MRSARIIGVGGLGLAWLLAGCDKGISDKDLAGKVIVSLADVRQSIATRDGGEPDHALLIDPRAPTAYAEGHLPGAVNLRLPDVREDDDRDEHLSRYRQLIVYGENPGTPVARAMFKRLRAAGYNGVRFYAEGLGEWARVVGDLETSEPPPAEE